jgi:hypothetical protein
MHRAVKPHPHLWAIPRASLRSVLLIRAFSTARMCRVSTQITGKPASARALNSHCDSGAGLFDRNVQSSKMVHAALLLLMLEAVHRTSFHHQPEAQHPKSSTIHKPPADYPIFWVCCAPAARWDRGGDHARLRARARDRKCAQGRSQRMTSAKRSVRPRRNAAPDAFAGRVAIKPARTARRSSGRRLSPLHL